MNDRELLERAAAAAGFEYECTSHTGYPQDDQHQVRQGDGSLVNWNPLEDDSDALRLAVDLELRVDTRFAGAVAVGTPREKLATEEYGSGRHAATRRAIVRAAAAMAKGE